MSQPGHACIVISKLKLLLVLTTFLLVPVAVGSCASNPPRVNNVQQWNQRLQGAWLLQSYRPYITLDAPTLALINIQFGQMRVTMDGTRFTAQGPGVQVARTYQIQASEDESAILIIADPSGVPIRVTVFLQDNLLTFHPLDAPWSGEGTLRRI